MPLMDLDPVFHDITLEATVKMALSYHRTKAKSGLIHNSRPTNGTSLGKQSNFHTEIVMFNRKTPKR